MKIVENFSHKNQQKFEGSFRASFKSTSPVFTDALSHQNFQDNAYIIKVQMIFEYHTLGIVSTDLTKV